MGKLVGKVRIHDLDDQKQTSYQPVLSMLI